MTGSIVVVPYDPALATQFSTVRDELAGLMSEAGVPTPGIEHVGSTSVPGLAAKPILDIDIVVRREHVDTASAALQAAGYEPMGEMGVTDRWAFRPPPGAARQNTYVVVDGSLCLRDHRALRDTLRADDVLRDRYAAVKLATAARTDDIDVYVDGKTDVIIEILRVAGIPEHELEELERINRL
jgi:GrpB-like predicted nucleotidyltransferase (UPF0157 family)